jgi:hypothetical protein
MARLLSEQNQKEDAKVLLRPLIGRLEEGSETEDLNIAKQMLVNL